MSSNKFSPLQLDKKTVAKLNDEQLRKVRGGHHGEPDKDSNSQCCGGVTCNAGHTITHITNQPQPKQKDGQSPVTHL